MPDGIVGGRMKSCVSFLRKQVLPVVICFGVAFALMRTTLFRRIEDLTGDERTKLRRQFDVTFPATELAVVGIDEDSLREFGRWPWDRKVHDRFMRALTFPRPAVVAWDILFTEGTPQDDSLAKAIAYNRSVILGGDTSDDPENGFTPAAALAARVRVHAFKKVEGDQTKILSAPTMLVPTGRLAEVSEIGFVDTPPGLDGVRRKAPLIVRVGDQVYPTLGLRTLMEYWDASADNVTVRLGDAVVIDAPLAHRRIPIDSTGAYLINYRHDLDGFNWYGYRYLYDRLMARYAAKQPIAIPAVSGRMLLIGQVADGLSDLGSTPFDPLTPLVLVHANVIENVLHEDYVHPVPVGWVWLGAGLVGLIGLVQFAEQKPLKQAAWAVGVPAAFLLVSFLVWISGNWLVPIVGPLLGFLALQVYTIGRRMLMELRAKEQIKGMFGTYVSPALVNRLVAAGKPPELGGHVEEITAYFSDIQDFSTFSEMLPPDRQVDLMNEYLTACTDILQESGGTLDKYIGDAIVAIFGAPVPLPDHALRACTGAVRVQQRLDELRTKWEREGEWPEIVFRMRTRIGLNTGECVIGNMGSRTRFNYTMMGDNVNLAARMESGAKSWGTYLMCTDATREACVRHGGDRVVFRPLGRIKVKGRSAAVPIFEIAGLSENFPEQGRECIAAFARGLERYYECDWDGAAAAFRRSAELELLTPEKSPGVKLNPSLAYLQIVEQFRREPPPPDWGGIYIMKEK